jgi:protein-S-isoprenylcysteine O-methyltransferase Ste14
MRLPVVAGALYFVGRETLNICDLVGRHPFFGGDWGFVATLVTRILMVEFLLALAGLYLIRHQPINRIAGIFPRVVAFGGLLMVFVLLLLPRAPSDAAWDGASALIVIVGSILAILSLLDLGRSYSVIPEARRLVTGGLYKGIRHPLYLAEAVSIVGVFLQFRSLEAATIVVIHFACQLGRIHWEERILGETFSEYADYRGRSNLLVSADLLRPRIRHLVVTLLVIVITSGLMASAISALPRVMNFPRMILQAPTGFGLDVLLYGRGSEAHCRDDLLAVRTVMHPICGDCKIISEQCIGADQDMLQRLSPGPLSGASISMPGGMIYLDSPDAEMAMTVCRYIAGQKLAGMRCAAPGEDRGRGRQPADP